MAKRAKRSRQEAPALFPSYPPDLEPLATRHLTGYLYDGLIATGKTGATYRLKEERTGQFYCLKTVRADITDIPTRNRVIESLRKECAILSPLEHRCLPRVYLHRQYQNTYFYICTFHPGRTFDEFRQKGMRLPQIESVFVIRSLMDTLRYLHDKGRHHCDLHSRNVLISQEVFQHGIMIIDFGSGHRESDSSLHTELRGNIYLKPENQKPLQNRSVVRHQQHFEVMDFKGVGELLTQMHDTFFAGANALVREAYKDFALALFNRRITRWEEAELAFAAVVDPLRVVTGNADLFLSHAGKLQEIPLPIVANVPVGEPSLALINTQVFQRLRNFRQLSFCDLFYPGAVHTRFEHSLGVFANAERALNRLAHEKRFREAVSPERARGFLLAALVHDVGHYPFAHVVEQYAASRLWKFPECKREANHAEHTLHLIRNDAEYQKVIQSHWGAEADQFAASLLSRSGGLLATLLDGPIDVDKIDYLRRDAHHAGMPYGSGVDIDGLFQNLAVVRGGKEIGILDSGVAAVEGLMILQDQMLASVYWHPIVRGAICMFHAALAHIVGDDPTAFLVLVRQLKNCRSENEAMRNVLEPACRRAAARLRKKQSKQDKHLDKRLLELVRFVADSHFPSVYRPISEHPRTERAAMEKGHITSVYAALVREQSHTGRGDLPIEWRNVKRLREKYLQVFAERKIEADDMDFVIDVPYGKAARDMLYVLVDSTGEEEEITRVSNLPSSIFTEPAAFTSPVRIYVSPRVMSQAPEHDLRELARLAEERFHRPDDTAHIESKPTIT
jgi:uncharacterized protein